MTEKNSDKRKAETMIRSELIEALLERNFYADFLGTCTDKQLQKRYENGRRQNDDLFSNDVRQEPKG